MAQRNQRGWLKKESRTHGETFVRLMRKWGKLGGRPRGSGKKKSK